MEVGDAFLKVDPEKSDHLWVVIAKSPGAVAVVNFTSRTSFSPDDTCIIAKGEHPLIAHDTIVYYQKALFVDEAALESVKGPGLVEMQDRVDDGLLRRIQEGALKSPYTPQDIQAAVRRAIE